MTEDKRIRLECIKLANDICKSQNVPYGTDEIKAEAEKVYTIIYPELAKKAENRNSYPTKL